ncbi:MAG: ABC-type transport auxiliary lipoprotein family protein [Candidatus Acidiferrales bacterium]
MRFAAQYRVLPAIFSRLCRTVPGASVAVLLLCLVLVDCGAARPVRYYSLENVPKSASANPSPFPVTLLVGHITAPHLYRDDRIVYGRGPVELGAYEDHRWAEMPEDMIENMILDMLRASEEYRDVERQSSKARGDYVLRGRLISLDEVDTPSVAARFAIELELFDSKTGAVVWSQSYSHDEAVNGKTVGNVVEALQTNVEAGLGQLMSSLSQYFTSHPAQ